MAPSRPQFDLELPEPFAALMVDYDEALASGSIPVPSAAAHDTIADALPEELRAAVDCLDVLERERRRRAVGDDQSRDSRADKSGEEESLPPPRYLATPTDSRFGRFEILRELGRGGQAVVFLARDPALNRLVALKVPRPDILITPSMRRRFLREGKAAAQLNHPNLVTVYEAGELGPICYLTQAYCQGINLAEWLRTQPAVPVAVAARIVAELADGVAHAHDRGVLHRDLKPSNILLEFHSARSEPSSAAVARLPGDFDFVPKLTDFGLAKILEPDGDDTATGALLGTASYMSPEQACGAHDTVGPATDVHGLGAILYELLTGQVAFRGNSHVDTFRKVASEEPTSPRALRADLPRDLEAICLRCLEKQPHRRYATAAQLADDLRRYLRGEPTRARPIRLHERAFKWARRRPTAAALFCVSVLALVLLAAISTWYSISLSRTLAASQASELRARELLYVSEIARAQEAWNRRNTREALEILERLRPAEGQFDLRGFAWHHLWSLAHDYVAELVGHEGDVYSVAASPDGQLWATAGRDGTVRLWSAAGAPRQILRGHEGEADYVCFSPDSRTLVSGGDDHTVRFWDVATGEQARVLTEHKEQISVICYAPDGARLATASADGTVRMWRAVDAVPLWSHQAHVSAVHSVAFSPTGSQMVTTGRDGYVRVWNVEGERPQLVHEFKENGGARCADFSDQDESLIVGFGNGVHAVYEARADQPHDLLSPAFAGSVMAQCVDENRNLVAAASADGTARLWDYGERRMLRVFQGQTDRLWAVALAPHDDLLAAASADGTVRVWRFDRDPAVPQASGLHWNRVTDFRPMSLDLSNDGRWIAMGFTGGETAVYDAHLSRLPVEFTPPVSPVNELRFSPDACWLASITADGQVRVAEVATGRRLLERQWEGEPQEVEFARDASWLAIGSYAGWIEILDTRTWKVIKRFESKVAVQGLALSPDGHTLVVPQGHTLLAWDTRTWQQVFRVERPGRAFWDVDFSPDGQLLATAESNRVIGLRDPRSGQLLQTLTGHEDDVSRLAFSPDGLTLASTGSEGPQIHLWDMRTRQELCSIDMPLSIHRATEIAFDPYGKALHGLVTRRFEPDYFVSWPTDFSRARTPRMTTPRDGDGDPSACQ